MALDLRSFTPARVSLGESISTSEVLRFSLDHARARDAVHAELDPASLHFPHTLLESGAKDRKTFLVRPDLGRRLKTQLTPGPYDAAILVADGLSALAVHRHAEALLEQLLPKFHDWKLSPIFVARQARVAIGDEVGAQCQAKLTIVLIGERPGLTSPDSLGAYITWNPGPGRTDADRNCVSNIRPQGLSYAAAAEMLFYLCSEAKNRSLSGVTLKGATRIPDPIGPGANS
ncbi:ethanolamine ammonia-lyase subunit EutC [Bryobacter aggregatus]|uniref:ethanolamine ammonia-lyase subunit EutC n=1 Tax=Bryobacter aggregatus TaxID=360054 RepID=UPI0004E27F0D|nr:ethanolamine ammonia-lyase subunit EutC [Bryobacter aggregatus]